jgi:hypothetical protein
MFLAGLRVANPDTYHRIGNGLLPINELSTLLEPLTENDYNFKWWFFVLAAGFRQDETWKTAFIEEIKRLKIIDDKTKDVNLTQIMGEYNQGWGRYYDGESGLKQVYHRIESIRTFSE